MGLKCTGVGFAEAVRELCRGVGEVVGESLAGEVEAPDYAVSQSVMAIWRCGDLATSPTRGESYLVSHSSPSLAVCFFVANSFLTRSCSVSLWRGAASCRSRIFLMLPSMSLLTGLNATLPRTSMCSHQYQCEIDKHEYENSGERIQRMRQA